MHDDAVYGLTVDPVNDDVFASACDDGKVHIYDLRASPAEGRNASFKPIYATQLGAYIDQFPNLYSTQL